MEINNLFIYVYGNKDCKKDMIDYLYFFAELAPNNDHSSRSLLHIEVNNNRRLLEDLCYNARAEDVRDLIELFLKLKVSLRLYNINKLISMAIDGNNNQEYAANLVYELSAYRKYFPDEEDYPERKDHSYLCLKALKKDQLIVAF